MKLLGLFVWVWTACSYSVCGQQNTCPTESSCLGCQNQGGRRIICSGGGLTTFPNLPPSLQQNVEELTLRNNGLTSVRREDLVNYTSLETLELPSNNISYIEPGSFDETVSLRRLDLTSNQLSTLPDELFINTQLTTLQLMDNMIESISAATFRGLQIFSTINLDNNQIQTIPNGTFSEIERIQQLILTNNPLICDCHLRWLPDFMNRSMENSPLISTFGTCDVPAQNLTDIPVNTLVTEDFECECNPPCVTGTCDTLVGVCQCDAGFLGTACDTACPAGSYGPGCLQTCTCMPERESSPCDHVDGTCYCLPGYNGSSCELECPDGYYGQDCEEECQCENGALCDLRTGSCNCSAGWMGQLCNITCQNGTYGANCLQLCTCSADHESSPCDRIDGRCYCEPGYTGRFCDIMGCPEGFYGDECAEEAPTQSKRAAIITGATVASAFVLTVAMVMITALAAYKLVLHVQKKRDVKMKISPAQQRVVADQAQLKNISNRHLSFDDEQTPVAEAGITIETITDMEITMETTPFP